MKKLTGNGLKDPFVKSVVKAVTCCGAFSCGILAFASIMAAGLISPLWLIGTVAAMIGLGVLIGIFNYLDN